MSALIRKWHGPTTAGLAGIWTDCPAGRYHAGCATPTPALSNSLLGLLLSESPYHAWHACPQLNPDWAPNESSRASAVGSVVHAIALQAGNAVEVLEFDSYQSKAAKEGKEAALAAGRIPILEVDHNKAVALALPLRAAAEAYLGDAMENCLREVCVLWEEGGFWRRALIDAITPELDRWIDLKTTLASVSPETSARRIYADGMHRQPAFYNRGLDVLDPDNAGRRYFAFIFGEQSAPSLVGPPIEMSEAGWTMARQEVETGCALWDSCVKTGNWPGFSADTYVAEPPTWALSQWQQRYESDERLNPVSSIEHTGWKQ